MTVPTIESIAAWFSALPEADQFAAARKFKQITGGTLSAYANPKPVAVALVSVDTNEGRRLMGVRRTIEPGLGRIALPGGFMEEGESAAMAAAREVREETGLDVLTSIHFVRDGQDCPAGNGTLLLFCRSVVALTLQQFEECAQALARSGDGEANELVLIDERTELAFPLHAKAAMGFFAAP